MFEWVCFLQSRDPWPIYNLILNMPQINLWPSLWQLLLQKGQSWSVVWWDTLVFRILIFAFIPPLLNTHPVDCQILWIPPQNIPPFRHSFLSCLWLDPWHLSPAMFKPLFVRPTCRQSVPTLAHLHDVQTPLRPIYHVDTHPRICPLLSLCLKDKV